MTSDPDLIQPDDLTQSQRLAVERAEEVIHDILYALEDELETDRRRLYVDSVTVDTRNFSQLRTEIWLTKRMRH